MLPLWTVFILLPILGGAERFNCRGRILGAYYADAKSGCKAFHVCVRVAGGGIRDFRFFCPPGTLFHQEAQTCTDWGDDDPLACPADLYDGQFDLYKIGSGYDTKKLSSQGTRDEEAEFGLQRAETGDRRLQQNNVNSGASDLRAAHSSDFFSGQRDRGRDDAAPTPASARPSPQSSSRQSFRRATTPRAPPTTQYSTTPPPPPPQPSTPQYETSKRKLVRKRPIYVSTPAPTTFAQTPQQSFSQKPFNNPPQQFAPQRLQQYREQPAQAPVLQKPQPPVPQKPQQVQPNPPQNYFQPQQQQQPQQNFQPQQQQQPQQNFQPQQQQQPQQNFQPQPPQQNFNRSPPQNRQTTPALPTNIPPEYKDEYVEVPRVAPKKSKQNRYYPNNPTPAPFFPSPSQNSNKKDGLVELYNYDAQSTPGLNIQNDNRPFKLRNSFNVQDGSREDFVKINVKVASTTADYNTAASRGFATSTSAYKNFNSVSYEPEKNNYVSSAKQNYYNSPSTTPSTTAYTTANFNTAAYNTNIALNTIQPANYNSDEDDGQYRPPEGEDDGQYRPELYERELLSGAHSLNIAASGNRLPEDQKKHGKSQFQQKPSSQTSVPRPFRPAATPSVAPMTTLAPEPTYTTTYRAPTANTQRTFDYFQTYTTTSRPSEQPVAPPQLNFVPVNNPPARPATAAPRAPEPRPQTRAPAPPTIASAPPSTRPPNFAKPTKTKQDDSSYDYAYYDSDTGFSEFDHVEEDFGRIKSRA